MPIEHLAPETLFAIFSHLIEVLPPFPGDDTKALEYKQALSRDTGQYRRSVGLEKHRASKYEWSRRDILTLARVNRRFFDICAELLYRHLALVDERGIVNSRKLQATLASSGAALQQRVIQLRIDYDRDQGCWLSMPPKQLFDPSGLTRLKTLELSGDVGRFGRPWPMPLALWFRAIPKLLGLERLTLRDLDIVLQNFADADIPLGGHGPVSLQLSHYLGHQHHQFLQTRGLLPMLPGTAHTYHRWGGPDLPRDAHAFAPFADTLETFTWFDTGASSRWWARAFSTSRFPLQARGLRAAKHLKVSSLLELMCGDNVGCAFGKTVETIELLEDGFDLRHVVGDWHPDRTEEERSLLRKLALDFVRIFKEDLGVVLLQCFSS
ncbi:hypothetical protein CSAL01_00571 [Colletotrichum salicis]|uniref:Uncharacterized protein n=1 Tax=Colletotrichum salicis TaxID=1209931 RepID=A0A135UPU2_9PEZI|nr:hypothetical protein CSAL01_00571 [Colletotrichum salicis]